MPRAQLGYFYPLSGRRPVDPGYDLGVEHPDQGLPGGGDYPDQGLPVPPPGQPGHPIVPGSPSHPIALPPGTVWPPLPPAAGTGKVWAFVAIEGYGHRWIVLELSASHPIAPAAPGTPSHPIEQPTPPAPAPHR